MNSVASTLNRGTDMEFNNRISVLTPNNWNTWKHDMQVLLMHYGCWQFIIQTKPEQPDEEATYKEKLDLQLLSKTSTETPSTSEKPDVSSDNHSLIPCTEVKVDSKYRKDNTESQGFSDLSEQQEALMVEVTIPNCYKQAIRSRDASKWRDAMDKEINTTVGDRLANTFTKDFSVWITNTFKNFFCLDNEHIFGGDQGDTPEIMDEILTTARDLELEVNEDDIKELIMGHEDELTAEEHQETQRNVFPSEQEENERGPMPTSAIKDLLKKWADVRAMVLEWHPNQAVSRVVGSLQ
ncbi:hypothetical protein TNCV_3322931 [Trichonephila clavipes]|nr:hypothetical protein TNCV_3322931 [Trichonephila clavipes]